MASNLYEQLLAMAAYSAANTPPNNHFNPRPPGCALAGSGTDQVHRLLLSVHPASLPTSEIRRRTGLGRGCIAWALRFLEHHKMVEAWRCDRRRGPGNYLRWKAVPSD
jgi:hypothetical protein